MEKRLNLKSILKSSIDSLNLSGVLCGINIDGELTTYSDPHIPESDHSRGYYIYSITKSFTAVAIMILCEREGDFLDKSLVELLPEKSIPKNITVRQILNHSGGLSDYGCKEYMDAVSKDPGNPWSYEKLMEYGLKETSLFEAGKGWSYSNPGYGLLKELIERLSGEDYYTFIDREIIKPLNLTNTKPFVEPDYQLQLLKAEDLSIEGDFRDLYHPGWIATGCLISTIEDVTKFYQALFAEKLISSLYLDQMKDSVDVPFKLPYPKIAAYGLGIMHIKNDPVGIGYGHGGGGPGYQTHAWHYPNLRGYSVTITFLFTKPNSVDPFNLVDEIVGRYLKNMEESI